MSYTTIDQIRPYLTRSFPTAQKIIDHQFVMNTTEYQTFFLAGMDATSLKVKSIQTTKHSKSLITLVAGDNSVTSSPIVRGQSVVASDSSLGIIYKENVDYVIDYENALLKFKDNGLLTIGQSVVVFYIPFIIYLTDIDYSIKASTSGIKRLASGNISDGETVFLDFVPLLTRFDDDILTSAVLSANGQIERDIDPSKEFGADFTLGQAATYLALELVCNSAATRELTSSVSGDKNALVWLKLAERFATKSSTLLSAFIPAKSAMSPPKHS